MQVLISSCHFKSIDHALPVNGFWGRLGLRPRPRIKIFFKNRPRAYFSQFLSSSWGPPWYKCKNEGSFSVIGSENFVKLNAHIEKWLDEECLSAVGGGPQKLDKWLSSGLQ